MNKAKYKMFHFLMVWLGHCQDVGSRPRFIPIQINSLAVLGSLNAYKCLKNEKLVVRKPIDHLSLRSSNLKVFLRHVCQLVFVPGIPDDKVSQSFFDEADLSASTDSGQDDRVRGITIDLLIKGLYINRKA
jgi:hypothetical protein